MSVLALILAGGLWRTWADANQGGRAIDSFLEGPSFDRQGRLYVTDIPFGRIFRIEPDGAWTFLSQQCNSNARFQNSRGLPFAIASDLARVLISYTSVAPGDLT